VVDMYQLGLVGRKEEEMNMVAGVIVEEQMWK
jgi:hypothetical protein